jgi:circadian clock protein KaiC
MSKRTATGIEGLDKLVEGGFPRGSMIVLAGSPGSGKTIASAQYLHHGVTKLGESGVYISFGERKEVFFENMERFGLDFKELEKSGKFTFLDLMTTSNAAVSDTLELALDEVRRIKAQRLVLDSFTALASAFSNKTEARIILQLLEKLMRDIGCTTLLLVEIPMGQTGLGLGFEEFVSDGIILFETVEVRSGIQKRSIIRKMRGTNHNQNYCKIVISDQGLSLTPYVA